MRDKYIFKKLFLNILGAEVEIQGVTVSEEEKEKRLFIRFLDSFQECVVRVKELEEKFSLPLSIWDLKYIQTIELLLEYSLDDYIIDAISWYIYDYPFLEEKDRYIKEVDGDPIPIRNSEDFYNFIWHLQNG
jgi:hypothetical protein